MDHEEYLAKVRDRVAAAAQAYLSGDVGLIETAHAITKSANELGASDDSDLTTFVAIESETDALPVGPSREYWAADALVEQDRAIAQAETFYRESATSSARALVARYRHT